MIWGLNDEKATVDFIDECIAWESKSPRLHYDFAITLKENGKLIGVCGIYLKDNLRQGVLGWVLHMKYWKQGYMPEAANALLSFGFEKLKLHRIYATCDADNYGSYRVMEKCDMRREAHFIKNRFGRNGDREHWYDEYHMR